MSKITVTTIAGQTSGADADKVKIESGDTLEVASNATVGGTLGVTGDATFDTNTLKVDSSNNRVGIGTASPLSDLHQDIGLTEREGHHLYYGTDAKAAFTVLPNTGEIRIGAATTGTSGNYNTEIMSRNGSNLITSIKADAYGRVTMPNQPVFHVTRVSNQSTTTNSSTSNPIQFPTSNAIVSSTHFNHTTHRFTAPVAGKYFFEWGYATNQPAGASVYRTFIWKNGARLNETQLRVDSNGNTSAYIYASRSAILSLAASDYVHLNSSCDAGHAFYADSQLRLHFEGYLLV